MPNRAGPPPVENRSVSVVTKRLDDVIHLMTQREDQFMSLVGADNLERWRTVALHALAANKNVLRDCTPVSIVEAIRESATLNLQPTGLLGEGWILPYGDTAKFMPGYRGYLKLLRNSGQIRTVDCQMVYLADDFRIEFGTEPKIHHVPALYGEKDEAGAYLADRGDYRGVYAYARLASGELVIEWMTIDDVNVVMSKSPSVQRGKASPWDDFYGEMARKTVLRRLIKRLPLETMPKVAEAATLDAEADVIEGTAVEISPAAATRATAAAYALGRGADAEPVAPEGASAEASEETGGLPVGQHSPAEAQLIEDAAAGDPGEEGEAEMMCRAPSPYGDGQFCVLFKGHGVNHKSGDRSTWT